MVSIIKYFDFVVIAGTHKQIVFVSDGPYSGCMDGLALIQFGHFGQVDQGVLEICLCVNYVIGLLEVIALRQFGFG